MSLVPTFQGETQFVTFADSSKGGPRITLRLSERDELEAFVGKEGKRFMCVLVEIGDDELPVPKPVVACTTPSSGQPKGGALSKLAGMWCNDPRFQEWLGSQDWSEAWPDKVNASETAAEGLREILDIETRASLDHDQAAAERFQMLIRGPYMKHLQSIGVTA